MSETHDTVTEPRILYLRVNPRNPNLKEIQAAMDHISNGLDMLFLETYRSGRFPTSGKLNLTELLQTAGAKLPTFLLPRGSEDSKGRITFDDFYSIGESQEFGPVPLDGACSAMAQQIVDHAILAWRENPDPAYVVHQVRARYKHKKSQRSPKMNNGI